MSQVLLMSHGCVIQGGSREQMVVDIKDRAAQQVIATKLWVVF